MSVPRAPHLIDELGRAAPLTAPTTVLGRSADCTIVIADTRASRRHAEISGHGDGYALRDLGSTNGTLLNGQRLSAPARLRDGDVLEIAGAQFTFHDPDATVETTHFPRLVVDAASGDIWVDRRPVSLSSRQRFLFNFLWERRGQVCNKDEIARAVWPECPSDIYDCQIESLVKRLRAKLEPEPARPALLVTVPGRGYRLIAPTSA
jgi:DNA-binding response OmpR family regulator